MKQPLIDAIRTGDPEIMQLFAAPFDEAEKWVTYLNRYFGPGGLSINKVLDNPQQWHSERFRALYVACWICHPLEKGSYMIYLKPKQKTNAEASAGKLTWRKSSHLSATSRSARGGKDFEFIKGYGELLILVEGNWLFLKMEGHRAASPSHLKSWYTKIKTGQGDMSNAHLNALATGDNAYVITARAAENYSKNYEALLKSLGLSGNTVTLAQVIGALTNKFSHLQLPDKSDTGQALKEYILQLCNSTQVKTSPIGHPLLSAQGDLLSLIDDVVRDEKRFPRDGIDFWGFDRIFHEVRLTSERIDRKLAKFMQGVQG